MLHFHTYFTKTEFFIFRNLVRYKRTYIGYTFHIFNLRFHTLSSDGSETIQMLINKYNTDIPDVVLHVIKYRCLYPRQGLTPKSDTMPMSQTCSYR